MPPPGLVHIRETRRSARDRLVGRGGVSVLQRLLQRLFLTPQRPYPVSLTQKAPDLTQSPQSGEPSGRKSWPGSPPRVLSADPTRGLRLCRCGSFFLPLALCAVAAS